VEVLNVGPSDATGVAVTDVLPSGVVYVSNASTQGTYSAVTGLWNVGIVPAGGTAYLFIVAQVAQAGDITNWANKTAQDEYDPNPGNDRDDVTLYAPSADLSVTKTAPETSATVGENITFTIAVTNNGPDHATGVTVKELLPPGLIFLEHELSHGSYDSLRNLWHLCTLHPGETATIAITAQINQSGTLTNTAEIISADQYDPNSTPGNNDPTEDDQDSHTLTAEEDTIPPWSWMTVTLDPDGYFVPASTFHIYADDDVGPWRIFYRIDDGGLRSGGWNEYVHFQINELHGYEPGLHTIEYWAVDGVGNEELPHHKETYVLVTTGPKATLSFEGIAEVTPGQRWQITQETLITMGTEPHVVGVDGIRYRLDDGDWTTYTGPFVITVQDTYRLSYYARDILGNIGPLRSRTIQVGGGEPVTTCRLSPDRPTGTNGWYVSPVTFHLIAHDEASGVASTLYRVDDGAWQSYEGPVTIDRDGAHSLQYYSMDRVGNVEQTREIAINIDYVAPEISISRPGSYMYLFDRPILPLPGGRPVVIGPLTVQATVADLATSGVANMSLYLDGRLRAEGADHITFELDERLWGRHTIEIVAYDAAGNRAAAAVTLYIINLDLLARGIR
ncbi:MAG TPA: DUF11 domain-containing protein, partial [Thermoplasmatales archaeon]|nr:DUF11 domain-containing protein [Thermoplasmatales archaeon]